MLCSVEGCDRLIDRMGYCLMHYTRFNRYGEPGQPNPMRITKYAGIECVIEDCHKAASHDEMCRVHYNISTLERQYNYKSSQLRTRFSLNLEDYSAILYDVQGGICPLCQTYAPSISSMLENKFWPVDHDHSCCSDRKVCGRCVRGVVCEPCNSILVALWDNADWRSRAFSYMGWECR